MLKWKSIILPMKNRNITQRGTQTSLDVMIGRCSLDSQYDASDWRPANISCSNFRYIKTKARNTSERYQRKIWTREDNKNVIHSYFKSNPTQRRYKKKIMEIWTESAKSNTSQRFAKRQIMFKKCPLHQLKHEILKTKSQQIPIKHLQC